MRVDDRRDAGSRSTEQLLSQSAPYLGFPNRRERTVDDISEISPRAPAGLGSALLDEPDARHIYRKMDIVRRVNDHELPRNVALLFFSSDPSLRFPGAAIETSILQSGTAGDVIQEKKFQGGLAEQVRGCLDYLRREVIGFEDQQDRSGACPKRPTTGRPLREVLVNALFHRGYGDDVPHTTLVRVTADRIDIRSTPGPVAGIDLDQLQPGAIPR
ncbi:MAG: hypothetical protein OXC31_06175, partial [Spirochaetaceae bacterium]|nr:hypothetical protein [Spirochaetaceae bacterium]